MKNKIIVICGFSASGKDSITKYMADNTHFKMITSTTSRPLRPNESEGNPYHFVSREQFENMIANDEFIECRKYNTNVGGKPDTWYYGVHRNSIDIENNNYVVVLDMLGLMELKKYFNNHIVSFFIDVDEPTRRHRCINRADFDIQEWTRRYEDDIKQFPKELIQREVDFIVENYNFDKCIHDIMRCLNE